MTKSILVLLIAILFCSGCSKNSFSPAEVTEPTISLSETVPTVSTIPAAETMDIAQEAIALAPEPEPAVELNTMVMTASVNLLTHLSRMIQKSAQEQEQTRKPRQDHVLQRQQDEKKQALGIRD